MGAVRDRPAAAREKALAWQRHVREVECGLTGGPGSQGTVRPQYDPQRHTLAEREQAKAEELTALGFGRVARTTVQRMRLAYRKQGLWGLLNHRTTRASSPTGRADERVVAAVREALRRRRGRSRGTINGVFPLINQILQDRHGPGTGAHAVPGHAVPAGHCSCPARRTAHGARAAGARECRRAGLHPATALRAR